MHWIALVLVLISGSAFANPFTPYDAYYELSHGTRILGEGRISLTDIGEQQYQIGYVSDASFLFLSDKRSEQSLFYLKDNKIEPIRYYMERSGTGKDFSEEVEFDAISQQIHARYKDQATDLPLQLPVYDNILYMAQLSYDLSQGAERMEYQYIRKLKQRDMVYQVMGEEQLQLPYGTVDTIKLTRVRDNNKRETYAWIAPELNYIIVQLKHYEEGDLKGSIALKSVTFD